MKRELSWGEFSKRTLPWLQVDINSYEIPQITLQFIIWGSNH
jgi:hypothetical protein